MSGTINGGTWTYSGDPSASDLDSVRFDISDTDQNDQRFSDEEILHTLAQQGSVRAAARRLTLLLAQGVARSPESKWVGDLKVEHATTRFADLMRASDELDQDGHGHNPRLVSGFAGGISASRKQAVAQDPERTRPTFYRGRGDERFTPDGNYGTGWAST